MPAFLVASTFAAFCLAIALLAVQPAAPFAALHVALAAGVMPLILGAITYFVPVLTRTRAPAPAVWLLALCALVAGWTAVAAFAMPAAPALTAAAALAGLAAVGLLTWIVWRGAHSIGRLHPGLHWYIAALVCLVLALAAVIAMEQFPEQRLALRRLHLHLNMLGFVALTAVGTLQVLLPTTLMAQDADAAKRLHQDLKWAVGGAVLTSIGAAWLPALAWAGLVLWAIPLTRLLLAWTGHFRNAIIALHGAAVSLAAALVGFILLLLSGALHSIGGLQGSHAVPAYFLGFLLPLVTGAVTHLLPLWIRPGAHTRWHDRVRHGLGRYAGVRVVLFLAAGSLAAFGEIEGLFIGAAGLVMFVLQALHTLVTTRRAEPGFS
jgi:hypothetical protein